MQSSRDSLLDLLKKAQSVGDILQVQNHLANTNQQLDVLLGQKKRMDGDVAYSLITYQARKMHNAPTHVRPFWDLQEVFSEAVSAMLRFCRRIVSALIFFAVFLPFVLIASLILFFLFRLLRNRISRRQD